MFFRSIKFYSLLLLFTASAYGDASFIYESSPATRTDKMSTQALTDSSGRIQCVMPATATSIAKNIDSAVGATDTGALALSIRDDSGATKTSTAGDAQGLYTNPKGALYMDYRYGWQSSTADGLLKLRDNAAGGTDAGVYALGIINVDESSLGTTEDDYLGLAVGGNGVLKVSVTNAAQKDGASGLLKNEDAASASGDAGVVPLVKLQSALTVDAADSDYGLLKAGLDGRLVTAAAPAGEMWYACSDAETGVVTNPIKSGVASNRMYVSSFTCSNTSAVASQITFLDGVTAIAIGSIPTLAAGGNYHATFPIPIRMAVNTQLGYIMTTTGTSTTCCATGYISVN